MEEEKYYKLSAIAKKYHVTKQAIYVAIKRKMLPALRVEGTVHWYIRESDYDAYRKARHDRSKKLINGSPLFDKEKGLYTVKEAAEMIGCSVMSLYLPIYRGKLGSVKFEGQYVIHIDAIKKFMKSRQTKR